MKPQGLKTKIFLDGGNPEETREIIGSLGFLDGQTTNPTLIAKSPGAKKRLDSGRKFSEGEIWDYYRSVVGTLSSLLPGGSVSVEVYCDSASPADRMLKQAREMSSWIPNAHIKFPISPEGLKAAELAVREGIRVNMTLCFTQGQGAAVYAATAGAAKGDVFLSPFVGRLDDRGQNGMDLIANILQMYKKGDGHVEVLSASVRTLDHFLCALKLGSDIITAPYAILKEWGEKGLMLPGADYKYDAAALGFKPIPYENLDLAKSWRDFDIAHDLTTKGMERFSEDWNSLIG
ncbi:MAG: transaldolase [Deltaproteobacteria bacterium]|nr:transaldolase [Deltaproteobacteria bacterium]